MVIFFLRPLGMGRSHPSHRRRNSFSFPFFPDKVGQNFAHRRTKNRPMPDHHFDPARVFVGIFLLPGTTNPPPPPRRRRQPRLQFPRHPSRPEDQPVCGGRCRRPRIAGPPPNKVLPSRGGGGTIFATKIKNRHNIIVGGGGWMMVNPHRPVSYTVDNCDQLTSDIDDLGQGYPRAHGSGSQEDPTPPSHILAPLSIPKRAHTVQPRKAHRFCFQYNTECEGLVYTVRFFSIAVFRRGFFFWILLIVICPPGEFALHGTLAIFVSFERFS